MKVILLQELKGKTGGHVHDVAFTALALQFLEQDDFHGSSLRQELKGKGGEGGGGDVGPGFANNYLLPQKVAILATKGNLKQLEQRKHNIAKREENRLADAGKIKETLDGALVKVEAKVGEEGQLFGSVTAQMIADAIKAATDVDVDRRRIELGHAIKTAGQHEVTISLYRDIKTTVKLFVGGADDEVAPAEAEVVEETIEEVVEAPAEETAEAAE